jgi:hypothetical protein
MEKLSNDAYVWIFGISPALDGDGSRRLLAQVEEFLDGWNAHGVPIPAAAEVVEGSFLIVAADENREKSGCSIDRMFGTLRGLEQALGVKILDANRVFLRDGGAVRAVGRSEFRTAATPATVVFDTTAEQLGAIRSGEWQRPAAQSWHAKLLG